MWTRTKTLNSYIRGSMKILLIQSKICHIFHYHMNIILKLMGEFISELVEIVHFTSIVTNFSVKPWGAKVFSLQIHLSSRYLRAAAVLILFSNMVTWRSWFKSWLLWKHFGSSLLFGLFWCRSDVWSSALKVAPLYVQDLAIGTLCSVNYFPFLAVSCTFYFFFYF